MDGWFAGWLNERSFTVRRNCSVPCYFLPSFSAAEIVVRLLLPWRLAFLLTCLQLTTCVYVEKSIGLEWNPYIIERHKFMVVCDMHRKFITEGIDMGRGCVIDTGQPVRVEVGWPDLELFMWRSGGIPDFISFQGEIMMREEIIIKSSLQSLLVVGVDLNYSSNLYLAYKNKWLLSFWLNENVWILLLRWKLVVCSSGLYPNELLILFNVALDPIWRDFLSYRRRFHWLCVLM